ncbi:MAG: HAD family phosphatase [Acidimicrobiia bacterium]|nr:HAD family phosphatase [Acidimicrobiia bacterium]
MSSDTGSPGIDVVIFDFGGVLGAGVSAMMSGASARVEVSGVNFLELMIGPRDADTDHPFHRLERGEISFDECNAAIAELALGAGLETAPALPAPEVMLAGLTPATEMIAAVGAIREAGFGTAILTNNLDGLPWRRAYDADSLVDVIVESWQVGMRKPAAEIFELTLDRLGGVAAGRALFLDDFPWNIAGAEAVGLQTLHVTDPAVDAATLLARLEL